MIGGRFEIGALIDHGGMGEVYRGLDTQTGQTVAIKTLRPTHKANPAWVERFAREGEALRQLLMDDFEHLLKGLGLVNAILQAAPAVKVLATSREPLNLTGEFRLRIEGMEVPGRKPDFSKKQMLESV
jgi:serine/threonine protein kinase